MAKLAQGGFAFCENPCWRFAPEAKHDAETNNLDNRKATMECVYFGKSTQWAKDTLDK